MKKYLLPLAIVIAAPAHADGQDAAPAPRDPDNGFRIEVLGGYDTDGFEKGGLYGVRLGYDARVTSKLRIGIDGEVNDVTTRQHFFLSPQSQLVLKDGPDLYVGARATVIVSRAFRLFGGAGYTRMRASRFLLANPAQPLGPVIGEQAYRDGYRLTGGAQLNLSRRVFVGAEYRYADYGRFTSSRSQTVASIGLRF